MISLPSPEAVAAILSCKAGELKSVAKKHGMSTTRATLTKKDWTHRLVNKCPSCEVHLKGNTCPKCSTKVDPSTQIELLEKIPGDTILISRGCRDCKSSIEFRAAHILKITKANGQFFPARLCDECKAPKTKKKTKTKRVKPVKKMNEKSHGREEREENLTWQPFKAAWDG